METSKEIKTETKQEPTNVTNNTGKDTTAEPTKYTAYNEFEKLKKDYEQLKYDFLKFQQENNEKNKQDRTEPNNNDKESLDEWTI